MLKNWFKIIFILGGVGLGIFFVVSSAGAQENLRSGRLYKLSNLNLGVDFNLYEENFIGGASVCVGDVNGDGQQEIIVGSGPGRRSEINIYSSQAQRTKYIIYPFPEEYKGGVDVACGDLDGDQVAEIVAAVASEGNAQIKVFRANEHRALISNFLAEPEEFQGGVHIDIGDVDLDGQGEIIVSRARGTRSRIRFFEMDGTPKDTLIYPFDNEYKNGADVSCADVDGDSQEEIIVSTYREHTAQIKVFETNGTQRSEFTAYIQDFQGGASVYAADLNQDGSAEIITGAGPGGTPHLRVFNMHGQIQNGYSFYVYDQTYDGGINVAGADLDNDRTAEIVAVPAIDYDFRGPKKIVIDISDQNIKALEGNFVVVDTIVSTGRPGMGTPIGEFKVLNKHPRAWSSRYGLYMPFWMQFTSRGHGMHELPEWPGGYKEGENHLGIRVSHGCVRLGVGPAEELFKWADLGTPVIVQE